MANATSQTDAGTYQVTADFAPTDNANYNTLTGADDCGCDSVDPLRVEHVAHSAPKEGELEDKAECAVVKSNGQEGESPSGLAESRRSLGRKNSMERPNLL